MKLEEIKQLAIECGAEAYSDKGCEDVLAFYENELAAYTAAVEARERERCAVVCAAMQRGWCSDDHLECAIAIRELK